jgi:hypothetical protein
MHHPARKRHRTDSAAASIVGSGMVAVRGWVVDRSSKVKKQPVLITNAARSQSDQLRARQIRYVTMMSARAACLIIGAVLVSVRPPLLPLWLILCAAGMILLPWAAVLIANDRPPKSRANPAATPAVHQQRVLEPEAAEVAKQRTIDVEP